jgi:Sulfotransferase domain
MTPQRKHGPPSVINAGLMRTGTLSIARAYDILGLRAHHGLDLPTLPTTLHLKQWALFERAAEGTWPHAPGARPSHRFKRQDWDELFGEYDVVTDLGAIFADQLVKCYPEAKVVIVQRDFDKWWQSFQSEVLDGGMFSLPIDTLYGIIGAITGLRSVKAMQKTLLGAFDARDLDGIKRNARTFYFGYYERIREVVPEERRLEYRLGEGWEPLCEFLGREVPEGVEFPRVNDREEHRARVMRDFRDTVGLCFTVLRPWILGAAVVLGLGIWLARLQN